MRRVEFLLLATRFRDRGDGVPAVAAPARAKAALSQSQTAAALGKTGPGLADAGPQRGLGDSEDLWRIGLRNIRQNPSNKAKIHKKVVPRGQCVLAVLDSNRTHCSA